jgi:hypothetical protein
MVFIYVLKLNQGKFYVGKTDNPKFRLDSHFKNGGCTWTKKYNPTQIIGLFPDCDDFDEDKYTLKYMSKHGIDNVRGGSFCQVILSIENKKTIERMISSSNDCCHFCGETGHFIGKCYKKKGKNKYSKQNKHFLELSKDYESADEVEWEESDDEEDERIPWTRKGPFQIGSNFYNESDLPAYSCGCSNGCGKNFSSREKEKIHTSKYCKTKPWKGKKEWWQCSYCIKGFDTKKGARFHENVHCKVKKQSTKREESDDEEISPENLEISFCELDKDDGIYMFNRKKYLWCDGELYEESSTKTPKKLLKYFEANDMRYTTDYVDYNWKSIHEKKKTPSTRKCGCHKCGRKGHYASNCYARKHINGNYL